MIGTSLQMGLGCWSRVKATTTEETRATSHTTHTAVRKQAERALVQRREAPKQEAEVDVPQMLVGKTQQRYKAI